MRKYFFYLFLFFGIFSVICRPLFAETPSSSVLKTTPHLSTLTPQITKGASLVIVSDADNTFDASNDIVFTLNGGSLKQEKVKDISADGRVINVLVPPKAQSGQVTIKNGANEIGKITVCVIDVIDYKSIPSLLAAASPELLFLVFLITTLLILKKNKWRLGDALSESDVLRNNDGSVITNTNGDPIYPRSISRLIAFIGLFGIITWILGLSFPAIYRLSCYGEMPDLSGVSTFLLAQAGIFTPYIANKISGAIK